MIVDESGQKHNQAAQSKEQGAPDQTSSKANQRIGQGAAGQTESAPYGMYVALAALVMISLVAFSAMVMFRDLFENATEVSTVLGSLFTVVGTVVGAYFGIKASGDTRDKMQGTIDRANEIANRALAELDAERSRRVVSNVDESK